MDLIGAMCFQQYVINKVDTEGEDWIVDSEEGFAPIGSHGGSGKIGSHEGVGTVDSHGGACTDIGQEAAGLDGACKKEDDESLFYGTHETHEAKKGGDSDEENDTCTKNPGHLEFIPFNAFNINQLPASQREDFEFIKVTADLTVRVDVGATSKDRPALWPNTSEAYPYHDPSERIEIRMGTGMVCYVKKWTDENAADKDNETCQCHNKVYVGEVCIYTANHVVFDDFEARQTTCRLFFDSKDSPMVTLGGWAMGKADINSDKCVLRCVTCDVGLLDKLIEMRRRWRALFSQKYRKDEPVGYKTRLMFIVSHPHGYPKKVSVGRWVDRKVVEGGRTKFTYTTCTCPGSSGAYVHPLMYDPLLYYYHHVHSGVNTAGLNFSGFGRETPLL